MTRHQSQAADNRIACEAAEWLLRLQEDQSPEARAEFAAWLRHSPRHMEEFLMLSATADAVRGIDAQRRIDVDELLQEIDANVTSLQVIEEAPAFVPASRRRWMRGLTIAATLSAVALLGSMTYEWNKNRYSTTVGEQRTVQMEDGSMLHLNTRSRVRIDYSRESRQIALLDGEALFVVAPDPERPFRVIAGGNVFEALGTQFNVYRTGDRTTVSVLEGRVRVDDGPVLTAGERMELGEDGSVLDRGPADVSAAVAWRQLRLVFKSNRLDEVASEFNRYNRTTIQVVGPAAELRMTGTFNANEPEGFLRFLESDRNLDIQRTADKIIVRARAGEPPTP